MPELRVFDRHRSGRRGDNSGSAKILFERGITVGPDSIANAGRATMKIHGRPGTRHPTLKLLVARAPLQLPEKAEVVIIGGGVIGTSAAFHLAEAGVDVLLLERAELGSGSTRRAAGGVRAQFSDALNIQIAQRSLAAFRDFARRPGWEIDLKTVGYLFVLTQEADVATFARSISLQNELGVPSRMVNPAAGATALPAA